ncbi:hypothetical protein N431DRAFT_325970 [Stipitochalara longipes BDJ]|nr:hypothetical protein N431DRAFT_325970 [Stipitochalara longipes BDJ]
MAQFNFNAPVVHEDGRITIEPNFPTSGPINKALAIARNSEVHPLLKEAGHLTAEEDSSIRMHHCQSEQKIFVGPKGEEQFDGCWLDEAAIRRLPSAHAQMVELRQLCLRRSEDNKSHKSDLELMLAAGADNPKRRDYKLGFTINPQGTQINAAKTNDKTLAQPDLIARTSELAASISTDLVRAYAPSEIIALLEIQADKDVPLTYGHTENRLFTSLQLNFSNVDDVDLQVAIGEVGGLHVDFHDCHRQWTVLLSLTNILDGYWPGRTVITDLRLYAVMAPMTAMIFKGVRPHISLGPIRMTGSTRNAYVPADEVPKLDPTKYVLSRIMVVGYPKAEVVEKSPSLIRQTTPAFLRGKDALFTSGPELLPFAIAAYGTMENQFTWHAQAAACNMARRAVQNPAIVIPSAQTIADMFAYQKDGQILTADLVKIQATLDANTKSLTNDTHQINFEAYDKKAKQTLSQRSFAKNSKKGRIVWTDDLGSSFKDMDPNLVDSSNGTEGKALKSRAELHGEYGPRPYGCEHCPKRFKDNSAAHTHHIGSHKNWEYQAVGPSYDLDHKQPSEEETHAAGAAESRAVDEDEVEVEVAEKKNAVSGGRKVTRNKRRKVIEDSDDE